MEIILGILHECVLLFRRMAPYLLFGYLFAGVLHVFVDTGMISKNLGKNTFGSVLKASLFGIPLPLCSCSVIPSAMSLRKEGASRGAVLSFLISTPTTGIDSIFATYSLLGWFFMIFRIISAFLTGLLAGVVANIFIKGGPEEKPANTGECKLCKHNHPEEHEHSVQERIKGVIAYAFDDLLRDSGTALVIGIFIGGIIAFFMPSGFIKTYMGSGILSMVIMLIAGIPMYVCATASIPIAAALMIKGLSPGAALVFLIAGPATNIVTMSVVLKNLGKSSLLVYLVSIVSGSILLGVLINNLSGMFNIPLFVSHKPESVQGFFNIVSSFFLAVLIARIYITGFTVKNEERVVGHGK